MISTILILNLNGEILLQRAYKEGVCKAECELFSQAVIAAKERGACPIKAIGNSHFVHIRIGKIILVAVCRGNGNIMLVVKTMYKIGEIFKAYFGSHSTMIGRTTPGVLDESCIRRNFVLIYELLDEIIDLGYPQVLETDMLKKYIAFASKSKIDLENTEALKKITVQATGSCSWRAEGIKYRKNEAYIDVVENVNVLISPKGQVLRADVSGQILVRCLLSGMPECKFGMNDKLVMPNRPTDYDSSTNTRAIVLDDCRFHQCVRLSKFDLERTITFIPPDGNFELMTYRITNNINLPFKLFPLLQERGRNRMEYSLKLRATFGKNLAASNVVVRLPCPKHTAKTTILRCSAGKAKYELGVEPAIVWRIRRFPGDCEYTVLAEVELANIVNAPRWNRPPLSVDFQVPMFTASGMCVRFLRIQDKSNYKAVKWIRYVTKAGSFQHRL